MLNYISTIVVDLDNTLFSTNEANYLAYKKAFATIKPSITFPPFDENKRFTKRSMDDIPYITMNERREIFRLKKEYFKDFLEKTRPNTVLIEALKNISQKYSIIFLTNASKRRSDELLEYYKISFHKYTFNNYYGSKYENFTKRFKGNLMRCYFLEDDKEEYENALKSYIPPKNVFLVKNFLRKHIIAQNDFLKQDTEAYYNVKYVGFRKPGNPDFLNYFKNTYNTFPEGLLQKSMQEFYHTLRTDLLVLSMLTFPEKYTISIIPRSKEQKFYQPNQLLFGKVIKKVISDYGLNDGSDYIIRHTSTKTTHLKNAIPNYDNSGDMPYPGITKNTCNFSWKIQKQNILLIDDIYTKTVNIDEDAIQSLYDNNAKNIIFYSVGYTQR